MMSYIPSYKQDTEWGSRAGVGFYHQFADTMHFATYFTLNHEDSSTNHDISISRFMTLNWGVLVCDENIYLPRLDFELFMLFWIFGLGISDLLVCVLFIILFRMFVFQMYAL